MTDDQRIKQLEEEVQYLRSIVTLLSKPRVEYAPLPSQPYQPFQPPFNPMAQPFLID